MINESKNKKIESKDSKTKSEYHFSGEQKFKPATIIASSREEAEEEFEKTKQEITN